MPLTPDFSGFTPRVLWVALVSARPFFCVSTTYMCTYLLSFGVRLLVQGLGGLAAEPLLAVFISSWRAREASLRCTAAVLLSRIRVRCSAVMRGVAARAVGAGVVDACVVAGLQFGSSSGA